MSMKMRDHFPRAFLLPHRLQFVKCPRVRYLHMRGLMGIFAARVRGFTSRVPPLSLSCVSSVDDLLFFVLPNTRRMMRWGFGSGDAGKWLWHSRHRRIVDCAVAIL